MRCDKCGLDKDPEIWFEAGKENCRQCEWNNNRFAAMAVAFMGTLAVAATTSKPKKEKFDLGWLKRSANQVKEVIQETAKVVSPNYAMSQRVIEEIKSKQTWHLMQPKCCAECKNESMLFFEEQTVGEAKLILWSSLCKVCVLIHCRYIEAEKKRELDAIAERKRLEAMPFRKIERTRNEKYTIYCTGCKEPHDPSKVRMVGTICEKACPYDERDNFEEHYQRWHGKNSNYNPSPARMMG